MLLAAGAVAALAAGGAAPCPTNAPKHPGTAASCAAFCSGQCSYHPDYAPMKPTNLTAYRLTAAKMLKYGIGNKDTGDAAGPPIAVLLRLRRWRLRRSGCRCRCSCC